MTHGWPILLGVGVMTVLFLWLPTRLRYRITPKHLQVTLFGMVLRRVALSNIAYVSKRHARWAESWWSTWRPFRRLLLIRRRRGLRKNFVITPKYRYVFKAELERAIEKAKADSQPQASSQPGTFPTEETEVAHEFDDDKADKSEPPSGLPSQ